MRTIAELLRWRARRHPDLQAIWFDGRSQTYRDLDASSSSIAAGLLDAYRLRRGDRVAILDKNSGDYIETLFALDKAGVVAAPLNWRLTAREIREIVEDMKPALIIAGNEFMPQAIETGFTTISFSDLPRGADDPKNDDDREVTWQFCTSGTTGLPKGAMLTGPAVLNTGLGLALEMPEMQESSRALVAMPMFHLAGAGWAIWAMQQGSSLVIVRDLSPESLATVITDQKIETALLVPAVMRSLTQLPASFLADFSSLRHVIYGTAPISPELLQRSAALLKCRLSQVYGLTETAGPFTTLLAEHHLGENILSCGRPLFGARVKVVGSNGIELKSGEIGEIVYHGESMMVGYYNRQGATEEVLMDGWFRTGDAGYIDEEGFIFIKDRIKDMIVSGGENVYPGEIEAVLAEHPGIAEVSVIGVPDEKWGETVKAIVVARPGSNISSNALLDWTRDRLAGYKRPRSVDFLDRLPRNASGKVLKRQLREQYWKGYQRKIN